MDEGVLVCCPGKACGSTGGKAMCESNDFWLANQLRLRYAEDFQGIEAFKITEE